METRGQSALKGGFVKPTPTAVMRTNIINMLETHLPDERKAIAERRAALESELKTLTELDATLEKIEGAIARAEEPTVLSIARKAGT
jgi:hypothetical protein